MDLVRGSDLVPRCILLEILRQWQYATSIEDDVPRFLKGCELTCMQMCKQRKPGPGNPPAIFSFSCRLVGVKPMPILLRPMDEDPAKTSFLKPHRGFVWSRLPPVLALGYTSPKPTTRIGFSIHVSG